jgi:putative MFS transporter
MTPFENAPFTPFHRRLVISGAAGQLSDGFSIGIIGVALSLAKVPLGLTDWWLGALGAASLIGLFFGSLIAGAITDRLGRRPIFAWGMLLFTAFATLQYLSSSLYQLFAIRVLLGVTLGADYVACKAMVTEYSPLRIRGQILSVLAAGWTTGYFFAFLIGFTVRESGPDAWRFALLASAVPSFIAFLLRHRTPESPQWLTRMGQPDKARDIITKFLGAGIALPLVDRPAIGEPGHAAAILKPPLFQNLLVGCVFHTSQVIPLFALGTFLPIVMAKAGVGDGYTGALIYNILFLLGALIGPFIIDQIPRRVLLVHGFIVMATLLAILIAWQTAPVAITILLFAAFAFVLSVAGILQFVYPPELFPTEVRARGIAGILATSRLGTVTSTFLLPVVVERYGVQAALGFCMVIMIVAAAVCRKWAPETLHKRLN